MSTTPAKKKAKKPKKRFEVGVGDLVMFYTAEQHMFGILGEITHVLDADHAVVRCLAPNNGGFAGIQTVLLTYRPSGVNKDGDEKHYFAQYITRVVHRAAPAAPKPPKTVLPPKVIETTEQLIEHLEKGDSKERIILPHNNTEKSA